MNSERKEILKELLFWKRALETTASNIIMGTRWVNQHRAFKKDKPYIIDIDKVIYSHLADIKRIDAEHTIIKQYYGKAVAQGLYGKYFVFHKDGIIKHYIFLYDNYLWDIDGEGFISFTFPKDLDCAYLFSNEDAAFYAHLKLPLPSKSWIGKHIDEVK